MYSIENSIAKINGANGIYDGVVQNSSVRYGRNSADNMKKYLQDYTIEPPKDSYPNLDGLSKANDDEFEQKMSALQNRIDEADKWLNSLPPLDFELRYMPNGKFDKMALMGAAYEELGKKTEVDTEELTSQIREAFGDEATAEALDLDKNGKVDLAEYSTSILLSDVMSTEKDSLSVKDANGVITNKGQDNMIPYANVKNYEIANKIYQAFYDTYDLKNAQNEFISNSNNMA